MAIVKLNNSGNEVRKLQLLLNAFVVPSPRLKIDGHFGQRTEQAVKVFQKTKGLAACRTSLCRQKSRQFKLRD